MTTTTNTPATIAVNSSIVRNAALRHVATRNYVENGEKFAITVTISLDDDCRNNIFDWSVTADVKRIARNGRRVDYCGGCCHDIIRKHFPKLAPFVNLHLSGRDGVPLYAVENGYYYAKNKPEQLIPALRVTEEEAAQLCAAEDKAYFKYLLFTLGIVDRWHKEAAAAIALLEEMTGRKWVNPYPAEIERERLTLSDEERAEIERKIAGGYYTPEAVAKRAEAAKIAELEKQRANVIARADKDIQKIRDEMTIRLFILSAGLSVENVIYYDHRNKVVFNWLPYERQTTEAEFEKLNAPELDRSQLPEGITFELKHNECNN